MTKRALMGMVAAALFTLIAASAQAEIRAAKVYRAPQITSADVQLTETSLPDVTALSRGEVPKTWVELQKYFLERDVRHVLDDDGDPGGPIDGETTKKGKKK